MSGYGRDESAPTPGGVVRGHFVGECGHFTGRSWAFRGMFATLLQSVSSEMAIRQQL
ncbi:hypothetical protein [Prevotella pallens]